MDVRPLRNGEQTALLDLVGLWPTLDDWPMRKQFERYVEDEPEFDPRDVWVAAEGARLVSCVQIFPRKLLVRGKSVPAGGIGTVFTHPDRRARGMASAVMRAAMEDLRARRLELGLLFAGPVPFYEKLGWHAWPVARPLLRPEGGDGEAALAASEPFDAPRDLAEVQAIHADYSRGRDGTCLREGERWWTNLRHAGNPTEEFRVVREGGRVVAYLRAVCLSRLLVLMEWGREDDAAPALATLFRAALAPRPEDPIAPIGRPSAEFRSVASLPPLFDAPLEAALGEAGIGSTTSEDRGSMFFVSDPHGFAMRFGEPFRPASDEQARAESGDLLRRVLPPERFGFWPADRF